MTANTFVCLSYALDKKVKFDITGVGGHDATRAFIICDVTPAGFRKLKTWYDEHAKKYDKVYRLAIPFSENTHTPAEYAMRFCGTVAKKEPLIARLMNCPRPLSEYKFEEILSPATTTGQAWPWKHEGTYADIVGNASHGDKLATIPEVLSGISFAQERAIEVSEKQRQNSHIAYFVASCFDLSLEKAAEQCFAQPTPKYAFHDARVPTHHYEGNLQELGEQLEEQTLPGRTDRHMKLSGRMSEKEFWHEGKLKRYEYPGEYYADWVKQRTQQLMRERSDIPLGKDHSAIARGDFIRLLMLRLPVIEGDDFTSFFDLTSEKKREFLRTTYGSDIARELLHIPVADVGREMYSRTLPPPKESPYDTLRKMIMGGEQSDEEENGEEMMMAVADSEVTLGGGKQRRTMSSQGYLTNAKKWHNAMMEEIYE